jgi:hypothetical protein
MRSKRGHLTRAYLMRCWQEGKAAFSEKLRWRFSLEGVLQNRPRQGFDTLEELIAFVQAELDDASGGAGGAADRKETQTERAREGDGQ